MCGPLLFNDQSPIDWPKLIFLRDSNHHFELDFKGFFDKIKLFFFGRTR